MKQKAEEAAVHKFLSNHFEKLFAGTRKARRAFYHRNYQWCFLQHRNFTEGLSSFDDLQYRIKRVNNNGL
jgi:hypothetical protein